MSPALNDIGMVLANSLQRRVLLQSNICSHCHHVSIKHLVDVLFRNLQTYSWVIQMQMNPSVNYLKEEHTCISGIPSPFRLPVVQSNLIAGCDLLLTRM